MSRWFRHYAGMMRDDKLVRVAIRSKQTIERVVWVWGAILESAAEIDDDGRFDVDSAEIAYFLRADQADTDSILAGLADAGRIASGCVVNWGNRQFTSDRSKDRVAAYRERKRSENIRHNDIETSRAADVTLQKRHCDAPETETETETEADKSNAIALPRAKSKRVDHRLPDDWEPAPFEPDHASHQITVAWQAGRIERELSKFKDHYRAAPGAKGLARDWQAKWRTWVTNADQFGGHNGHAGQSNISASGGIREERTDVATRMHRRACAAIEAEGPAAYSEDYSGDWLSVSPLGSG